jgi:hypothetical protein
MKQMAAHIRQYVRLAGERICADMGGVLFGHVGGSTMCR